MACFPLNPASDTAVNQDRRPTRSHSGRYNEHPVRPVAMVCCSECLNLVDLLEDKFTGNKSLLVLENAHSREESHALPTRSTKV